MLQETAEVVFSVFDLDVDVIATIDSSSDVVDHVIIYPDVQYHQLVVHSQTPSCSTAVMATLTLSWPLDSPVSLPCTVQTVPTVCLAMTRYLGTTPVTTGRERQCVWRATRYLGLTV